MRSGRILVVALLANPLPALAQTCQVPADHATIDAALAVPTCAQIDVAAGTYVVSLEIERAVTINGAGQGQTILAPPSPGLAPVVLVGTTGTLLLQDLTVHGDTAGTTGYSRHGIANTNILQINRVEVTNFEVGVIDYPSALRGTRTQLFSCNIHENYRGVQTESSMLLMQACTVSLNSPNGGVFMLEGNILDSTIANNFQQGDGGGIFIQKSGSISDSEIIGNLALGAVDDNADGGGIFILGDSGFASLSVPTEVIIDDSLIEGNYANGFGGGVAVHRYTTPPAPTMPGGKGPTLPPSGSQHVYLGNLVMTDSIVRNNVSNHIGGGVSVRGTAVIEDSVIDGNRAVRDAAFFTQGFGDGGGVGLHLGEATIERTAIVRNTASMNGGGIVNGIGSGGTLTLRNSTVAQNRADLHGGGLYNRDFTQIQNTTIAGNVADDDGDDDGDGGGIGNGFQVRVQSSIIFDNADNSPTSVLADCSGGGLITFGYNLLPDSVSCPLGVPTPPLGPDLQYDPLLKPGLGGKFTEDHGTYVLAHRRGSAIADAGYCKYLPIDGTFDGPVDQRGLSRVKQDGNKDSGADSDGCDIGAFEIQN